MNYPKMIIFDYGHTLFYEPGWNAVKGGRAVFQYVTENPRGITPEEYSDFSNEIFASLQDARSAGGEIHEHHRLRLINEYLQLKFTISLDEIERVFWDNASTGALMPGADEMIKYINKQRIRSAVISNISWSGKTLENRINRLLPCNKFEFIMTSSEYGIRKPNPLLFKTALSKARIDASEVWYCGDNPQADVEGSARVGIFPVWYDSDLEKYYKDLLVETTPTCKHLYIKEWSEMTDILESMK